MDRYCTDVPEHLIEAITNVCSYKLFMKHKRTHCENKFRE
jgi:hypothetical protein